MARQLGDPTAERDETHALAVLDAEPARSSARAAPPPPEARAGYERALALARQLGDPAAERAETHEPAVLEHNAGNLDEARVGYERALALARQLGDPVGEAAELRNLGILLARNGEQTRDVP